MDYWIQKNLNADFDSNGDWAKSGIVKTELVSYFKQDPYFSATFPKSTGTEYFSPSWLHTQLETFNQPVEPADVQASLCQLTAESIVDAIKVCAPETQKVLLCGGGVHNHSLVAAIKQQLSCTVESTAVTGIDPDHVEAMAFAWLAKQTMTGQTGSISAVTGAKLASVLGGIYPRTNGIK